MNIFATINKILFICVSFALPAVASAQPFVTCEGVGPNACNACHLVQTGNTILFWLIGVLFALFAVFLFMAGFKLVTSGGNPTAKSQAKSQLTNAFIGILIVLSAWLIVDTVMKGLVAGNGNLSAVNTGFGPWNQIQCAGQPVPVEFTQDPPEDDTSAVAATSPGTFTSVDSSLLGPSCNPGTSNFPSCAEVNITTNNNMNPIFDCSSGCSSMVRSGAEARMQETLNGPFAALQAAFGSPLVINDALAKSGTSRESQTPGSRHFYGDALDISLAGMSDSDRIRLFNEARAAGFTGFGFGNNILHIDRGAPRAWDYGNSTYGGVSTSALIAEARG